MHHVGLAGEHGLIGAAQQAWRNQPSRGIRGSQVTNARAARMVTPPSPSRAVPVRDDDVDIVTAGRERGGQRNNAGLSRATATDAERGNEDDPQAAHYSTVTDLARLRG